ncbi:YqeG family HAD IIIA-type phosphatase [Dehalobacter sp. DCM]|uniref:YqeG family HAD IIIA-type phosphatase n=1 Tax=Dehalobacter sp. DCM TaxID=2907827 RepID=UPI0030821298|nr:YqeG family HAD IIIA-type phosphatase [Dehalobacter sp. DCM]
MRGLLRPDLEYDLVQDIKVEDLHAYGIKGVILDLDNTITPWNDRTITKEVIVWFKMLKTAGIQACIVSNNKGPDRVSTVANLLEIQYVHRAKKPRKSAFRKGLDVLGLPESEVAVIGDQLFTDIFGGNVSGMKTILVSPIHSKEYPGTKVLRFMERLVGRKARYTRQ